MLHALKTSEKTSKKTLKTIKRTIFHKKQTLMNLKTRLQYVKITYFDIVIYLNNLFKPNIFTLSNS